MRLTSKLPFKIFLVDIYICIPLLLFHRETSWLCQLCFRTFYFLLKDGDNAVK